MRAAMMAAAAHDMLQLPACSAQRAGCEPRARRHSTPLRAVAWCRGYLRPHLLPRQLQESLLFRHHHRMKMQLSLLRSPVPRALPRESEIARSPPQLADYIAERYPGGAFSQASETPT